MAIIDDQKIILREQRVREHLLYQFAVCQHFDLGLVTHLVLKPHRVSNLLPDLAT